MTSPDKPKKCTRPEFPRKKPNTATLCRTSSKTFRFMPGDSRLVRRSPSCTPNGAQKNSNRFSSHKLGRKKSREKSSRPFFPSFFPRLKFHEDGHGCTVLGFAQIREPRRCRRA